MVLQQIEFIPEMIDGNNILVHPVSHQGNGITLQVILQFSSFSFCIRLVSELDCLKKWDGIISGIPIESLGKLGFFCARLNCITLHVVPNQCWHCRIFQRSLGWHLSRILELYLVRSCYLNASDGIDGNEGKTILGRMVVCAFQQNGIPELIPKAEINTHRGIQVCRHLSECGAQLNLVHFSMH